MIDTVLVIDESDNTLGSFFQSCQNDLYAFFNLTGVNPTLINSNRLNDLSIKVTTEPLEKFIFGAYSHGDKNCLVKAQLPYISTALNNSFFKNSFFYTFSCSSGYELGSNLIENGCLTFIGYNQVISIWSTYIKPFVECANYGLIRFYDGEDTYSIVEQMKVKYTNEIDSIYSSDFLIASILRENRDALVIHGENININNIK
ncbi:MAG: hypothetical protein BM557_01370 [Flavobacterium sp. MedPE-SWcel]|uniref:hypothetical protein n=1 Tax=uncultured Flavobacterium sp. TaxID=165435 RepID=UPI00090F31D1|nr:hypothetical protein [uncultured Flavobacterium sp.]OIQ22056.1 MAG: hypothetical protein BM557_01370 [Flavobacterium sp. MedPE-SWcel]